MRARIAFALGLWLALAGCAKDAATTAANPDVFKDESVGFEVTKPAGWFYFSPEREGQKPLVAFSKYREPYDDLNPSFEVIVEPVAKLEGKGALVALRQIAEAQRAAYAGKITKQPTLVDVGGKQAAYTRFDYEADLPDGRQIPVAVELWIVPAGARAFLLDAGTRPDEKTGPRSDIEAIVRSIKISP